MFHLELRQFPNNLCRFNLTERELSELVLTRWARGQWVELEDRKWSPDRATLTVLEGPEIPVEQLTMGRGWRYAQRVSRDVTAQVLASSDGAVAPSGTSWGAHPADESPPLPAGEELRLRSDSLGLELLSMLGGGPVPLLAAWRLALERMPERSAGECLAIAEGAVRSLLGSGLIVLSSSSDEPVSAACELDEIDREAALRAPESWAPGDEEQGVWLHRV